jgi:8-oxo-dGTP pyrophosphatase MutT (NUDIX family)
VLTEPRKPIAPDEPAATVILLRDAPAGVEILMLRRNSKLNFAGGLWVFPGGRVDDADRTGLPTEDACGAAKVCAAREAAEESALEIEPADLIPFSHWTPPDNSPRRFLTWFFVCRAPLGNVSIDQGEIHDHRWVTAADGMRKVQTDEIQVLPPTFVTLAMLAEFSTVETALAGVHALPVDIYRTRIGLTPEGPTALWEGDAGYAASDPNQKGPRHRLLMASGGWEYFRERTEEL